MCVCACVPVPDALALPPYEEEDTCASYEEEDTCTFMSMLCLMLLPCLLCACMCACVCICACVRVCVCAFAYACATHTHTRTVHTSACAQGKERTHARTHARTRAGTHPCDLKKEKGTHFVEEFRVKRQHVTLIRLA